MHMVRFILYDWCVLQLWTSACFVKRVNTGKYNCGLLYLQHFSISIVGFFWSFFFFWYFFLTGSERQKRITLEIMIHLSWSCTAASALTGSPSQHHHMRVRHVSQSARNDGFSENRISDSAPTWRKLCSVTTVLMPFTYCVLDVSKVCSKNEKQFPLRPHTSILRYLFFMLKHCPSIKLSCEQTLLYRTSRCKLPA